METEKITALLLPVVIWLLTKIAPAKREEIKKPIDDVEDFILSLLFIVGFFCGLYFYGRPTVDGNDIWPLSLSLNLSLVLPALFLKIKYNSLLVGIRSVLAQNANEVSRKVLKYIMSVYAAGAFISCIAAIHENVF